MFEENSVDLEYDGDLDVTVWLEQSNDGPPRVFPEWPDDFPKYAPVGATEDGDLFVARSQRSMLAERHPGVLWFCRMPVADIVASTDVDESWFQGG